MTTKFLSLIIPTYNMEALLPRCLDSLVKAVNANLLDILIVNDGSKDNSSAIGHLYETQYPDIVRVIDKPNGNYGSTINAALPVARGKYVKILDADDWFDTQALDIFLQALPRTDADVLLTHFSQIGKQVTEVVRYNTMGRQPYTYGKVYRLDDILPDGHIRFFLMHALTYRTRLLREIHYRQTEGISYTDTQWACYPIFHAQTIEFHNLNLYQYNLDREGQTMDPKVLQKSVLQLQTVIDHMLDYYTLHIGQLSAVRQRWMKQYYENRLRILYKIYLLDMPRQNFCEAELEAMDAKYLPICRQNNFHVQLYPENKLLRIEYISWWRKHKRRWAPWLECLNHFTDTIVKALYVKLFRR